MATTIIMPRQGQSVESCIITKWAKKEGDTVAEGDVLFSYETDKAAFDEVSKVSGVLLKRFTEEGDDVPCLERVAIIGEAGEDISGLVQEGAAAPEQAAAAQSPGPEAVSQSAGTETEPRSAQAGLSPLVDPSYHTPAFVPGIGTAGEPPDGGIKISPRAKAIAQNQMLDLSQAIPTGPSGRIIERDVLALSRSGAFLNTAEADGTAAARSADEKPAAQQKTVNGQFKPMTLPGVKDLSGGAYEDIPLSNIRKSIAKAMHHSISSMAQLTHSFSFDAAQIIEYRKLLKAGGDALSLENITYNDMILFAVSRVLLNHKDLNTHFLDGKMRYFEDVNLGMAVDTPRGLLVPTIFGANKMTLNEIAAEAKSLAKQAQAGTISPDYLQNGSFTISNLGAFGVEHFTPVINPPQTGIIGVNNIQVKLRLLEDGQTAPYQAMGFSLTYDHRAVDGAPASRFMQELCRTLENFTVLLAK